MRPAEKEVIKIGAVLPLSGSLTDGGNSIKAGLEEAKNDIINLYKF
jgi:ABC-type branched-subunit amino acid transport system substrate-binding protein